MRHRIFAAVIVTVVSGWACSTSADPVDTAAETEPAPTTQASGSTEQEPVSSTTTTEAAFVPPTVEDLAGIAEAFNEVCDSAVMAAYPEEFSFAREPADGKSTGLSVFLFDEYVEVCMPFVVEMMRDTFGFRPDTIEAAISTPRDNNERSGATADGIWLGHWSAEPDTWRVFVVPSQ